MLLPSAQESSVSNTGLPDLAKIGGLSEEEARRRLKQEGPHELSMSRKRSLFYIALSVVREPMFGKSALLLGVLQGLRVLALVLVVFGLAQVWHLGEPTTRAVTFTTLVLANLGLILVNRSRPRPILATLRKHNIVLWWVGGGTILLLVLVLSIPVLRELFAFSLPSPLELLWCLAAGIASLLWCEAVKVLTRRYVMHG